MTDSDKSFTELKFYIISFVCFLLLVFIIPILGIILSLMQYSPSGSEEDFFWINPFITIIPIIYFCLSIFLLIKKRFLRGVFIFVFGMFFLSEIFIIYGMKEIKNDYLTLFEKIRIVKK